MRYRQPLTTLIAALAGMPWANASECPAPPVATASQAICYAKLFVARQKPAWEVEYKAQEAQGHWLVFYSPAGDVLGGAGDLRIDKATAQVTLVRGYK